jgi:hypothetical protein
MTRNPEIPRRDALRMMANVGVASALAPMIHGCASTTSRQPDLIRAENERPGTREWLPKNGRVAGNRCPWVEGYCSRTSVRPGQTIDFFVSTAPASPFLIDLYRIGYYQGQGGRHLQRLGPFPGKPQEVPAVGALRLRECRWEPSVRFSVPMDWPSGIYVGKLTAEREGIESYLIFVVRDDRPADFMIQTSDTTWQAYNEWPGQYSMYYHDSRKGQMGYHGSETAVSYNRPYQQFRFNGPFAAGTGNFFTLEVPLVHWMEAAGYDVTYVSSLDTHGDPAGLDRVRGFLSVAHDEYYTPSMFRNLKDAIGRGLSIAFLSGNTCYEAIELAPGADGTPDRAFHRAAIFGPHDPEEDKVIEWGRPALPAGYPSEATLIGAETIFPVMSAGDWTCVLPEHWAFRGTGMKKGDSIPGLVGYEWHGNPAAIPGLEVVASGVATNGKQRGVYTGTCYPGPKGNIVFNASTIWWVNGLSAPPGYRHKPWYGVAPLGPDRRVQQITANVLGRMKAGDRG